MRILFKIHEKKEDPITPQSKLKFSLFFEKKSTFFDANHIPLI